MDSVEFLLFFHDEDKCVMSSGEEGGASQTNDFPPNKSHGLTKETKEPKKRLPFHSFHPRLGTKKKFFAPALLLNWSEFWKEKKLIWQVRQKNSLHKKDLSKRKTDAFSAFRSSLINYLQVIKSNVIILTTENECIVCPERETWSMEWWEKNSNQCHF